MTQTDFGTIDPSTKSGTQLASDLNAFRDTLYTQHSGATRPSYIQAGQVWLDTSAAPLWLVKIYDGADDIVVARVDTSGNVYTVAPKRQEVVKTADYTLTANDAFIATVMNKSSAATLTLPAIAGSRNELYFVRNTSAFPVTIDPNASETINGLTTIVLAPGASAWIWPNAASSDWISTVAFPLGGTGSPIGGFLNQVINGDFAIWQRATTQTASGYGSDDRWANENSGSTKTHSQQPFGLGQTAVPGNPKYYSRTVVTSVAGTGNYCKKSQRLEGVDRLAGKTATLTFYAKADASKNIAVELLQNFGTGGSPSSSVTGINVKTCALTTTWQVFSFPVTLPSISGKVLGSNNNDFTQLTFWFDAGSSFNAETNSLIQQNGTFDVAHVSLRLGTDALAEIDPFCPRHQQQELALCQRYFETGVNALLIYQLASGTLLSSASFAVAKRAIPTLVPGFGYSNASGGTVVIRASGFDFYATVSGTASAQLTTAWTADAEL